MVEHLSLTIEIQGGWVHSPASPSVGLSNLFVWNAKTTNTQWSNKDNPHRPMLPMWLLVRISSSVYSIPTLKSIIYSMFNILHAIHFNWYVYLVKRFHESIAIDDNIWYNIYQGVSHNNEDTCILTFVLLAKESFTNKLIFIKKKNLRWSVRCNVVNKMVMFKSVFVDIFITWFINCYLKPQEKPIHYILSENIVWMEN